MKKYLYIFILFSSLSLVACEDFLSEDPRSVVAPENAFNSPDDWQQSLTGAYGMLQEVFVANYTIVLSEFGTDEVIPFDMGWAAYSQLHYYTFSAQHEFFAVHYSDCYEGIKRANTVIDMPEGAVSSALRNEMVAQAKFLRGIYYFDLVRMYGGVPLWLEASIDRDAIMKPRATVDEVYTQIVEDIGAALVLPETWPNAKDKGRATKYAAQALLARVYLQWGKPEEALAYCRELEGKFNLYEDLSDIFDPANKNMEYENIFEIQFMHSGSWGLEGSIQHSYWGPRGVGGPTNFGGWGGFGPTQYVYNSFDDDDDRKEAFFITEFAGVTQTPPSTRKFWDDEYGNLIEDDQLNFTLIRYADVLLMRAEALNSMGDNSNEKYDALNAVRNRAGLPSITVADGLTSTQFSDVLLNERLHELCFEHMRRWDLIRFGKLQEYVEDRAGVTIQDFHSLYPLPQAAIDANDAIPENNPGY